MPLAPWRQRQETAPIGDIRGDGQARGRSKIRRRRILVFDRIKR